MKRLLIASVLGGAAKTTSAVRLAEAWRKEGRTAAVAELSPWPTASLLRIDDKVSVRSLEAPASEAAAAARLKPIEADVVLLDAARLDDPTLLHWAPCCHAVLLTTRCDDFSLAALQGAWPLLEGLREANPDLEFLGFLPTMIQPGDDDGYSRLKAAARSYLIDHPIVYDAAERRRSQKSCFEGQDPLPAALDRKSAESYAAAAATLATRLDLPAPKPVEEEAPKETGLFTRLWRKATAGVKRVRVEEASV